MAENSLSQITPISNENGLKYVEREGQIFFSSEEIGRQLGYAKPSKSINTIFNRNQKELQGYATGIKLMQVDGCLREVRCFTEEGVYILSMLANTPQAREFRGKLARLLREIRERRLDFARESAYRQGYDEGRASALPDALDAEKKARKEAAETMLALCPQRRETLKKALRYARMGLSCREITKLLDGNQRQIGHLLSLARKNGLLPPAKATPALRQGSLLEAGERA